MEQFSSRFGPIEFTEERLKHILTFHPEIRAYRKHFQITLYEPQVIRRSKFDPKAFIFYKAIQGKYLAIVVKTNSRNFILTAYLTSKIQHQPL